MTLSRPVRVFLLVLIVGIAVFRIAKTYSLYNETTDEPNHVGAGMEWLQYGRFTAELKHPPLGRISVALGPYLDGARYYGKGDLVSVGNEALFSTAQYWRVLTLARLGTLAWFLVTCAFLYLLSMRYLGPAAALAAVLLFTLLPTVLTHAGLATIDMAATAVFLIFAYAMLRYVEEPGNGRAALLGLAGAAVLATKLSVVIFLPLSFGPLLFALPRPWPWRPLIRHASIASLVAVVAVSAVYRFEWPADNRLGIPLPMVQTARAFRELLAHNEDGHKAVFLGEFRTTGWWYFFPVLLALKSPIGFLGLWLAGAGLALRRWREVSPAVRICVWVPLAVLLMCAPSHINIGLRHAMPLYPFAAMLGAYALCSTPRKLLAPVALLLLFCVMESATAFPDHLPWFNFLAPENREYITSDSDLDWGQDLQRLSDYLRENKIDGVHVFYSGSMRMDRVGYGSWKGLPYEHPVAGHIAISAYARQVGCLGDKRFCWLDNFTPEGRIGGSILLYYIPDHPVFSDTPQSR